MFRVGGGGMEDGKGPQVKAGVVKDSGGRRGTSRVMSHDALMIRLDVYDFNLAITGVRAKGYSPLQSVRSSRSLV